MPIFEYQCTMCKKKYEIFHIGREKVEDIVCPECNSREYKKWFSPTNISTQNTSSSPCQDGACDIRQGGCKSGMCNID